MVPAQFPPVAFPATIVSPRKTKPSSSTSLPFLIPPPEGAELSATVVLSAVSRLNTSRPPPDWDAVLPEIVEFSTVAAPSPSVKSPPPCSARVFASVLRFTSSGASPA
jgi:hypothetical protein